jgi:type I restriction-modification system DNA methylase subunit
MVDKIFEDSSQ